MESPHRSSSPRPILSRRTSRRDANPTIDTLQSLLSPTRQPHCARRGSMGGSLARRVTLCSRDSMEDELLGREPREWNNDPSVRRDDDKELRGGDGRKARRPVPSRLEFTDGPSLREGLRSNERGSQDSVGAARGLNRRVSFAGFATTIDYQPGDSSDEDDAEDVAVTPRGRSRGRSPRKRSSTPFAKRKSGKEPDKESGEKGNVVTCPQCGHVAELRFVTGVGTNIAPGI